MDGPEAETTSASRLYYLGLRRFRAYISPAKGVADEDAVRLRVKLLLASNDRLTPTTTASSALGYNTTCSTNLSQNRRMYIISSRYLVGHFPLKTR